MDRLGAPLVHPVDVRHAGPKMKMVAAPVLLLIGTLWGTTGCSLAFPSDDYTGGGGQGAGGALQGDALLARYFIDEAASGTEPLALTDASSTGPDLFITYDTDLQFGERQGNRGLFWVDTSSDGDAHGPIGGTALVDALGAAQEATFELVVAVDDWPGTLVALTEGVALVVSATGLEASWPDHFFSWSGFSVGEQRRVLHLRIDTAASQPVALLKDGVSLPKEVGSDVEQDAEMSLATATADLWLGNDSNGGESVEGGILYLAIYGSALTNAQIDHNVAVLLASDDAP